MLIRVISAAILLPIVIGVIALGGWPFYIAIVLIMLLAVYEFQQLMQHGD